MKIEHIDPGRLEMLNAGQSETAVLAEALAVDFVALLGAALPQLGAAAVARARAAAGLGISRRMTSMGHILADQMTDGELARLIEHPSDTVRGWACFALASKPERRVESQLEALRPFADDPHFGVREWSWLAVRPAITRHLDDAIGCLVGWTSDPSERLRRFVSEATRPRGVWCAHLTALKQNPARALPLLEPLSADPSVYVQKSVGNWLNDAAKDHPDWVSERCALWRAASDAAATKRICKLAQRSLGSTNRRQRGDR